MSAPILTVEGLNARYGRAQALFDIDLTLGEGAVVALRGGNGAAKSTMLKALIGLVDAEARRLD